jgi:hypothetical protein
MACRLLLVAPGPAPVLAEPMQQARRLDIIVSRPRKQMKPSQELMKYLRARNGTGPDWNPDWDVRIGVLQELDKLSKYDPKERIL